MHKTTRPLWPKLRTSEMTTREKVAAFLLDRDEGGNTMTWSTMFVALYKDSQHDGDCSKAEKPAPYSCSRCTVDEALLHADQLIAIINGE